jgi:hypothetical protein
VKYVPASLTRLDSDGVRIHAKVRNLAVVTLLRLQEAPWWGKILAPFVAILGAVFEEFFVALGIVLVMAQSLDLYLGSRAAARRGVVPEDLVADHRRKIPFSWKVFWWGAESKAATIGFVITWRAAEYVLSLATPIHTAGWLSTAIVITVLAGELESIEHHRRALGSRAIPLVSLLVAWMRKVSMKLLPEELRHDPQANEDAMRSEREERPTRTPEATDE